MTDSFISMIYKSCIYLLQVSFNLNTRQPARFTDSEKGLMADARLAGASASKSTNSWFDTKNSVGDWRTDCFRFLPPKIKKYHPGCLRCLYTVLTVFWQMIHAYHNCWDPQKATPKHIYTSRISQFKCIGYIASTKLVTNGHSRFDTGTIVKSGLNQMKQVCLNPIFIG